MLFASSDYSWGFYFFLVLVGMGYLVESAIKSPVVQKGVGHWLFGFFK